MKTKILSLILALLMLLSLSLVGCKKEEQTPPSPQAPVTPPTESLFSNLTITNKNITAPVINTLELKDINSISYLGEMLLSSKQTYNADNTALETITYTLSSIYKENASVELSQRVLSYDDPEYATAPIRVTFTQNGDFYLATIVYGDDSRDMLLYNKYAVKIAERVDIEKDYLSKLNTLISMDSRFNSTHSSELFSFLGNIYIVNEDETLTHVVDASKASINLDKLVYNSRNKTFFTTTSTSLTTLNSKLEVINTCTIPRFSNTLSGWSATMGYDAMLFVNIIALPDDATDYQFIYSSHKAKAVIYKVDIATCAVTELSVGSFLPISQIYTPVAEDEMGYTANDGAISVYSYYEIVDKQLISKSNLVSVDESLNVVKYITPINNSITELSITQNGMAIVETAFGRYYLSNEGKLSSIVKNDSVYNNLWCIADNREVYNSSNSLIYTIPENYTLEKVLLSSLILSSETKDTTTGIETKNYYLYTGQSELKHICSSSSSVTGATTISTLDTSSYSGYVVTITSLETYTSTFVYYDDAGTELARITSVSSIMGRIDINETGSIILKCDVVNADGSISTTYKVVTKAIPNA